MRRVWCVNMQLIVQLVITLCFLDADDILLPRAGEVMAREALQKSIDFIVGYFYRETEKEMILN